MSGTIIGISCNQSKNLDNTFSPSVSTIILLFHTILPNGIGSFTWNSRTAFVLFVCLFSYIEFLSTKWRLAIHKNIYEITWIFKFTSPGKMYVFERQLDWDECRTLVMKSDHKIFKRQLVPGLSCMNSAWYSPLYYPKYQLQRMIWRIHNSWVCQGEFLWHDVLNKTSFNLFILVVQLAWSWKEVVKRKKYNVICSAIQI